MVDLSLQDQIVQNLGRPVLHLIDVDAGVEQQTLSANQTRIDERKPVVASTCQRPLRIEPRPASRRIEIKFRHFKKPSFNSGSTLPRDSLNTCAKLSSSATVASANSIRSVSVSMARLSPGLLDQRRAYPSSDPAAFFTEETGLLRRPHDRVETAPC